MASVSSCSSIVKTTELPAPPQCLGYCSNLVQDILAAMSLQASENKSFKMPHNFCLSQEDGLALDKWLVAQNTLTTKKAQLAPLDLVDIALVLSRAKSRLVAINMQITTLPPFPQDSLNYLYIGMNRLTDLSPLSRQGRCLSQLDLSHNPITDISALAHCTALTELSLSCCQVTDVKPLAKCRQITELNLSCNSELEDLSALSSLWRLKDLNLSKCNITSVKGLSSLTRLTALDVSCNTVSDFDPLKNHHCLVFLSVWGNPITDLTAVASVSCNDGFNTLLLLHDQDCFETPNEVLARWKDRHSITPPTTSSSSSSSPATSTATSPNLQEEEEEGGDTFGL